MPQKPHFEIVLMTCRERELTRGRTLASLAETDFVGDIWTVCDNDIVSPPSRARSIKNFQRAMGFCSEFATHYLGRARHVLLVEDDVIFNRHLLHNLERWHSYLCAHGVVGSLYRTALGHVLGNQALLATPKMWAALQLRAEKLPWRALDPQDTWLRRVASVIHHPPSLVDHNDTRSTLNHPTHRAIDFDPHWLAP